MDSHSSYCKDTDRMRGSLAVLLISAAVLIA